MDAVKEGTIKSGEDGFLQESLSEPGMVAFNCIADAQATKFTVTKKRAEEAAEAAAVASQSAQVIRADPEMTSSSISNVKKNASKRPRQESTKKQHLGSTKMRSRPAVAILPPSRQRYEENPYHHERCL